MYVMLLFYYNKLYHVVFQKVSSHENMHLTHKNILEPMDDVVFRFYVTDFHFS